MNKLFFVAIPAVLFAANCFAQKPLSQAEIDKFKISNDSVFYDKKHIANYIHIEYEYYLGKKTMEICFQQVDPVATDVTDKLVEYVHVKHPNAKVEVRIPHKSFW
jgi:hypothetical protein